MKYTVWVLRKVIRFCFKYIIGLMAVFLFSSFITVSVNFLNKLVVNEILQKTSLNYIFYLILFAFLLVWLLSRFIGYLEAFANNLFRLKVDMFLHKILMKKSVDTEQEMFYCSDFMEKYTYVCSNTNMASTLIFKIITILFSNIAVIFSSILVFFRYEKLLILFVLLVLLLQTLDTIVVSNLRYRLSKEQIKEERISNYLYSLYTNRPTAKEMRIFDFSGFVLSKWRENNSRYINKQIKNDDKNELYNNVVSIFSLLLRFIAIFILVFGVKQGKYDVGTFVMLYGLSLTCSDGVRSLAQNIFSGLFNEARYFKDYYDIVFPITNKEIRENIQDKGKLSVDLCFGEMERLDLKNICYTYPNTSKQVLSNINLYIKKGEIVSILGYNGSGKTTLSKVLYGALSPKEGTVMINNCNINDYPKQEVFKYFGIAPQEYSRFSVSIRDNVRLGCVEKMDDEKEIELAYSKTKLYELFNKYYKKDHTIIGKEYDPEGIELSGGEMQRVVITSAYMGTSEVLILDEPTASIDPIKEVEMLRDFREALSGKTAILISHRIGFARIGDRIVIMQDGEIVEDGTHDELLNSGGLYAIMFEAQRKLYE